MVHVLHKIYKRVLIAMFAIIGISSSTKLNAETRKPMDKYELLAKKLDQIESEMRGIKLDNLPKPTKEQLAFTAAFAADTLAFEQWLWYIFIPKVRDIIAKREEIPESMVGAYAVKNLDRGDEDRLQTLLSEFDAVCNK